MATVTAVEQKLTSTNKPYKRVTLADGRNVSVWVDHPAYNEVGIGYEIPDNLLYQKGQYWNLSNPAHKARAGATTRANNQRSEQIKEAQDRKEQSIAFFNATNSAITLVSAKGMNDDDAQIKDDIRHWRDWFLTEHDNYKGHKERYPTDDPLEDVAREKQAEEISADDIPW